MKISQVEPLYITLKEWSEKEVSFSLAYKIARIMNKIENDYNFFTQKLRSIISKYGEKDDKGDLIIEGSTVKLNPENIEAAEKELQDLYNIEVDDISIKLNIQELEDIGHISPSQLQALLPIIEE